MNELSLDSLSLWLNQHPHWILGSLLLTAFIESLAIAGIVVPGVAILFAVAVVAGGADIPLILALGAAMAGAVAGDVLSFFLGRHFSERLTSIWPFSRFPKAIASGTRYFHRHGGLSVVIGRFVGPIRPVLPLIAGALGMQPWRFVSINVLSALAWAPVYVLPGYLVGAAVNVTPPENWLTLSASTLLTLTVFAFVFRYASQQLQDGQSWQRSLSRAVLFRNFQYADSPSASLVLLLTSVLSLFIWTLIHLNSSILIQLDIAWLELASSFSIEALRNAFIVITAVGDERFLQISFCIAVATLFIAKRPGSALMLALSGLAISALTHGAKDLFAISRPDILANPFSGFAYPSGHTSGSMVFYGLIACLIAERAPPLGRWKIYLLVCSPALLIGLSRVVLGVHWFSDVIAGLLTGCIVCATTHIAYAHWRPKPDIKHKESLPLTTEPSRSAKIYLCGIAIWLLALGTYQWLMWDQLSTTYQLK